MRKKMAIGAALGTAFLGGALLSPIGLASAGHTNEVLVADLDGRDEVTKGDPNGRGEAYVFGIDGADGMTTLCYVLTVDKVATVTGAHIHEGAAGENGPVVANLAAPGSDGDAADCLTEGETGPGTTLKFPTEEAGIVQRILSNPEDFYVNVHTDEYPGGAIRGQLEAR